MSFKTWQSYSLFSQKILHKQRYLHDQETKDFLFEVVKTCQFRRRHLKTGQILWRAQVGGELRELTDDEGNNIGEASCSHPPKRMYPLERMATEGRANAKGIPCLYLATTKETAISECRPWIGSEVSVAQFKLMRDLTVIDCSVDLSPIPLYLDVNKGFYEPDEPEKEKAVWAHIGQAFSHPIIPNENQAHYVPTQILAEAFKINGFDGIFYKSMLGEGYNVALFDVGNAALVNCTLYIVKSLYFEFEQA